MKIKLIIFDFDGTLGDTRANIIMTMQETMRVLGYPVAGEEAIAATIGLTLEDGFRELFPGLTERDILRCADVYRDLFEKNRRKMIPTLFPHVKETLNLLKERGYILSVASSRQSVSLRGFLHDMSVEDCISYIRMTQATILSVPTLVYAPFCFFNILSPLMSFAIGAIGWKIVRNKVEAPVTVSESQDEA